jgi:outer membrane protein TolC
MKQLVLYIFFGVAGAAAQGQNLLSLTDAINMALKNSLDIQLNKNQLESDSILNNYGVAGGLPLVTGNLTDNERVSSINQKLNSGENISRNAAANNIFATDITASMLLYNGNRVVATKKRLGLLQLQSQELLNAQVQNIMAGVMTGYFDVVRQQSYLKTIDRSIDASNQQLEIVKARQSVGLANNADLFQAQIDLNALQQTRQSQEVIIAQAKTELLRQLTLKADSLIHINDTIIVDRSINLDVILNSLHKNAEILAADEQVRINEQLVKETAALRYPSVRATTGYTFSRNQSAGGQLLLNQNYGPFLGVSVGIPIYNGSVFRRQQQVASINVRNATLSKEILVRDYNARAVTAYQSYAATLQQLLTEQQNYDLSNRLLELTLQRFRLKQATIVEVKNAQQSFEESGYRLVNLSFAAKSSEIELKRLANLLSL